MWSALPASLKTALLDASNQFREEDPFGLALGLSADEADEAV